MIKILVDRTKPTSEEVKNRQNFDSILIKATENGTKKILPWYYGVVGLASFILAIVSILL
jgi:hypothetical protein